LVKLEDEGCAERIESFWAIELDWKLSVNLTGSGRQAGIKSSPPIECEDLLKPTPGLGVETIKCSYCGAEAYPRTSLGRPVDLNCEATRDDDLNACILYVIENSP
jgi:hypothetical protein